MGFKYQNWRSSSQHSPKSPKDLSTIIKNNRSFEQASSLEYGDHGLESALNAIVGAIKDNRRVALYADYDVDGTMSCVSWIWFLQSIGFTNFVHYIPDRFKEGYGVNLKAVQHLVQEAKAELIITMDTGITANEEARWCQEQGVTFICTDHHKIQPDKMPDSIILNPKTHPDPNYQELCGCGITFVLLRKLGKIFKPPQEVWTDILALAGMATICDVVPLNGVNHKIAQQGIRALTRSQRPVLKQLIASTMLSAKMTETDVGFKLGPRINAVGRLDHANKVIDAFLKEDNIDTLLNFMNACNEKRKSLQAKIVDMASMSAKSRSEETGIFLGDPDWHQGVVGIAASRMSESFWKPTWLFQRGEETCKGSARSIPGLDITAIMMKLDKYFLKYGGHAAAAGFSFERKHEEDLASALADVCAQEKENHPELWTSSIEFDCWLPHELLNLGLLDELDGMRPFGHGFEEPRFGIDAEIDSVRFYPDKVTKKPKHTAVSILTSDGDLQKIMFFNEVYEDLKKKDRAKFIVNPSRNHWQGRDHLSLIGIDYET